MFNIFNFSVGDLLFDKKLNEVLHKYMFLIKKNNLKAIVNKVG